MALETHHFNVTYDAANRIYTVLLTAEYAHVLIWGGDKDDVEKAESELRRSLAAAEDTQMPADHYADLFG